MKYTLLLLCVALFAGCQLNEASTNPPSETNANIPTDTTESLVNEPVEPEVEIATTTKAISFSELGNSATFSFSAEIPSGWELEYIPAIEAMNIYDPTMKADSNLEKSQIFIRYFSANTFLTLSTVEIHGRTETETNGRPTVVYDIEKKPGVANFPSQPTWRNARHTVTDIRSTDSNPAVFYVFAKKPDLDQATFDAFISSVKFE